MDFTSINKEAKSKKKKKTRDKAEVACNLCENLFPNKHQLQQHTRLTHSKLPILRCEHAECQEDVFKTKKMLHKHLEKTIIFAQTCVS